MIEVSGVDYWLMFLISYTIGLTLGALVGLCWGWMLFKKTLDNKIKKAELIKTNKKGFGLSYVY